MPKAVPRAAFAARQRMRLAREARLLQSGTPFLEWIFSFLSSNTLQYHQIQNEVRALARLLRTFQPTSTFACDIAFHASIFPVLVL